MSGSGIVSPFGAEYASTSTLPALDAIKRESDPVADHQAVIDAWGIPPGHVMVVRDRVEAVDSNVVLSKVTRDDGQAVPIFGSEDRRDLMQTFQPWATVLMVGDPYITDFGQTIQPPPVKPGMRVLIVATAAEDIDLEADGQSMRVTLVGFRAIKLWRKE